MIITGISHRPLGLEHPYQQEPDERSPRQPLAGRPVTLGVLTWPAGAASRVWVTWRDSSQADEQSAEGTWMEDQAEQSNWRVTLPPSDLGQRVEYSLHASNQESQLNSPLYSFTAMDWKSSGEPSGFRLTADGVEIHFQAGQAVPETSLVLNMQAAGQVSFLLGASHPKDTDKEEERSTAFTVLEQSATYLALAAGELQVDLCLQPFRITVNRAGKTLLATSTLPQWLVGATGETPRSVRLAFDSPPDEGFYGLGERFHAFNQRGTCPDLRVFEQYKNQGLRTYIPVSFFLSSRGYGFYLHTARYAIFDLAAAQRDCWSCEAELGREGQLSFDLFAAGSPLENLRCFSRQTGLPELPPAWVFGPWMSSNEWNSQAEVMKQVQLTQAYDIPASVLVIEAWSDETTFYIWNDASYTPRPGAQALSYHDFTFPPDGRWPDPQGMVDELHRQGIRLVLWQIPVMKNLFGEQHAQHDADEAFMLEKSYCLHHEDGTPYYVRPFWFRDALLVDFSNPQAVEWWMSKRAYLLDEMGIDGFKTDGGEHLWGSEVVFANGMCSDEGINLYPNLYAGAYHRFARQKRSGDAVTFSRAGFTGAQAFPCHWAGDENSTWDAFRASLLAGLSAGLSGIPFWGWDIAGFSGEIPEAELYLRAVAMAAFCPIMQYHSEYNGHRLPLHDRTPWNIAERTGRPEVIDIYRKFAQLRMRMLPYIEAEARHCAESGEPMMRPLFLDWPEDPQAWQIADQYCFGRALLVAPVLHPGLRQRKLYLPAGQWQSLWDETHYTGGQWITIPSLLDSLPVFRRLDLPWKILE